MPYSLGEFPVYAGGGAAGSVTVTQSGLMTVFDCACSYTSREVLRLAAVCDGQFVPLGVVAPAMDSAAVSASAIAEGTAPENSILLLKKNFSKNGLATLGFDNPSSYHLIRAGDVYIGFAPSESPADSDDEATAAPPPDDALKAESVLSDKLPEEEPEAVSAEPSADKDDLEYVPLEESFFPLPDPKPLVNEEPAFGDGWMPADDPGAFFRDPYLSEACSVISDALTAERDGSLLLAVPVSADEPFPLMAIFCFGSSGVIGGREYIIFKSKDGTLTL